MTKRNIFHRNEIHLGVNVCTELPLQTTPKTKFEFNEIWITKRERKKSHVIDFIYFYSFFLLESTPFARFILSFTSLLSQTMHKLTNEQLKLELAVIFLRQNWNVEHISFLYNLKKIKAYTKPCGFYLRKFRFFVAIKNSSFFFFFSALLIISSPLSLTSGFAQFGSNLFFLYFCSVFFCRHRGKVLRLLWNLFRNTD